MSELIPTPVTLEDLIDVTSAVNVINVAATAQVSPRRNGTDTVIDQVKDDPLAPTFTSGTCDANVLNSVSDSTHAGFIAAGVEVGDAVIATVSGLSAIVTVVAANVLTLDGDPCPAGTEAYTVIKPSYWVQKGTGGEWKRSNIKTGKDASVAYTLPVDTNSTVVHSIVYPIALANIATYPPIS